jgi:hypothetical protein
MVDFVHNFSFLILNPIKNCMFSSCYHAFLVVAIFIFIKRNKIIKAPRMASRIHLYKKENSETLFLDILKASVLCFFQRVPISYFPEVGWLSRGMGG